MYTLIIYKKNRDKDIFRFDTISGLFNFLKEYTEEILEDSIIAELEFDIIQVKK